MEAIAEINDLTCQAIEFGEYRIALDVLNSCLGCVKQLKRCRSSPTTEDRTYRTNNLINIFADEGRQTTIETVAKLLKGTKRKLINGSAAAAASNAFISRNKNNNNNNKRKAPVLPRMERRRRTTDNNLGEVDPAPPREAPITTVEEDSIPPPAMVSRKVSLDPSQNSVNQPQYCPSINDEFEQQFFVSSKPMRLTKYQWSLIRKSQNSQIDHESQCQIEKEIELAVSANLIFNIALTHHLIVFPAVNFKGESTEILPDKDNETDDDTTDDETGFDESCSPNSSEMITSLKTTSRLKGALRLYELGFRVHTKRVASLTSLSANPSPQGARTVSFLSLAEDRQRLRTRDDELKSTTRFVLALMNNCCHIHQELCQKEKAEVFQKRLLSFILVIIDSGSSLHDIVGDDPSLEGYLKNVFDGTVFHRNNGPAAVA